MAESRRMHRLSGGVVRFSMGKTLHWPAGADVRQKSVPGGAMLYDASRVGNAEVDWFDPLWWRKRAQVRVLEEGRGSAMLIDVDGRRLVLRHYRRGGWAARISSDRYRWREADATRSFAELHLLYL